MPRLSGPPLSDRAFAALVAIAYLPVALFAIEHHEMWRDELHCWLVARDSATPWACVHNRAYDGQPPLWYLLLWVLEKTTHDPRSMQVLHVGFAVACVWVFARLAPFPRALRALFPFGYFLAYEYVALSRCYGLALLLTLTLCANHPRRLQRPWLTAALLAALALTTTVATMVAAAYAFVLCVETVGAWRRERHFRPSRLVPIGVAVLAGAAAGACAWPPADSTVTRIGWPTELPSDDGPTRLIVALFPVPRVDFFFWNSNLLLSWDPFRRVALACSAGLAAWLLFVLSTHRGAVLLFAVGSALLVALFTFVYGGDVRHQGFLFVLLIASAWIARGDAQPVGEPACGSRGLRRRALVPTLLVVLVVHVAGTPIALYYDGRYVFSSGRRAADALRASALADAPLVAEMDFPATAAIGWLGRGAFATSVRTGRPFSFVRWTRDRHWDPSDEQTLRFALDEATSLRQNVALLMNRPLRPELVDGRSVVRVAELYDSMIEEENFYIYRVQTAP